MHEMPLLEPSFADAIAAIGQDTNLSLSKRTHWGCSLRQIAKALDRPTQSLAARWVAVAQRINRLHHCETRMEFKTLANHKSNAKAGLLWFRNEHSLPLHGGVLIPEWQQLWRCLPDRSRRAKLSGLGRYSSMKGIRPAAVTEGVFDDYMRYRGETTALAVNNKARRAIARAWNWCAEHISGWPPQRLVQPPIEMRAGPRYEDFPVGFRNELDTYLAALAKPHRGPGGKRLRACKPLTIRTRRVELIGLAKKVVRIGVPIGELTSLAALLNPDLVERVLEDDWTRNGDTPKTSTIDLAKKSLSIARFLGCLNEAEIRRLDDMRANLEQYRQEGLTPKNLQLIRQVLNGEVWSRVVNCPNTLMARARSLKDRAPLKAAVTAQVAVAIAILTVAPIRASNLAAIRLDENLIKPGGVDAPYWLVFPDYDVKNRIDLNFPLDPYLTALIDEYVRDFRPTLVRGSNQSWLFPGSLAGSKDAHLFGIQISARIRKETGLRMTIHQFRHAAAAIYLKHHPGDYETVRRFLGHRNIRTTMKFYCGLETIHATRLFGQLIQKHFRFEPESTGTEPPR